MIRHHFFNKKSRIETLAEAVLALQSGPLSDNDKEAISFLVQSIYKPPAARINPVKVPFKAAALFVAGKGEQRTYLRHIRVKDGRVEASDGKTLIQIGGQASRADGWYDKKGSFIEQPGNAYWPEFGKCIQTDDPVGVVNLVYAPIEGVICADNNSTVRLARRFQPDPMGMPSFFGVDLTDRLIRIGFVEAVLFGGPGNWRLAARQGGVVAVVMALRT